MMSPQFEGMTEEVLPGRVVELVPEALWQRVQALLPERPPRRHRSSVLHAVERYSSFHHDFGSSR